MAIADLLRPALMYLVVPLWFAAGFADYLCHRAALIERTSGPKEAFLHLVQFALVGLALLAVLFLEVNAGIVLVMAVCLVLHQAAAIWDVRYANRTRFVSPAEQHVHGILEAVPFVAVLLVSVLHWTAVLSLFGIGAASFAPVLKQEPLPTGYLAAVLAAVVSLGVVPYGAELLRTLRGQPLRASAR